MIVLILVVKLIDYNEFVDDRVEVVSPREKTKLIYRQADLAFENDRFEESINLYTRAIHLDDRLASAWYGRAKVYCQIGNYRKAYSDSLQAIMRSFRNNDFAESLYIQALALQGMGRNTEALESLELCLRYVPNHKAGVELKGALATKNQLSCQTQNPPLLELSLSPCSRPDQYCALAILREKGILRYQFSNSSGQIEAGVLKEQESQLLISSLNEEMLDLTDEDPAEPEWPLMGTLTFNGRRTNFRGLTKGIGAIIQTLLNTPSLNSGMRRTLDWCGSFFPQPKPTVTP